MMPTSSRQLVTKIDASGTLELRFEQSLLVPPAHGEVLIRIEAAPINPADIKHMFCQLAPDAIATEGEGWSASAKGKFTASQMAQYPGRIGLPLACGNEGAGLVVAAGDDPAAQALIGCRVSVAAGGMFADYRTAPAKDCILLPEGLEARQGAAGWVNPLTALAMTETMRREGHQALILTAAASSLGRMLGRHCRKEGIGLVNVVRSPRQVSELQEQGETHVCDSSREDFDRQIELAIAQTGATLAFDATGGGDLAGRILRAMDRALSQTEAGYNRYGSARHKQLYFFGGLNPEPVRFTRDFGMAWGMGGWFLQTTLARLDEETVREMKAKVSAGIETTFATRFAREIPLSAILDPDNFSQFMRLGSGGKFLVVMAPG